MENIINELNGSFGFRFPVDSECWEEEDGTVCIITGNADDVTGTLYQVDRSTGEYRHKGTLPGCFFTDWKGQDG